MNNATQLSMNLGAKSGTETAEPYAQGNVLVTTSGKRVVITSVDSDIHGLVFLAVNLSTGAECVVLEREVAYRSHG